MENNNNTPKPEVPKVLSTMGLTQNDIKPQPTSNPKPKKINDTYSFNGKNYWSGAVNRLDGVIEEPHTYKESKNNNFHHSLIFSEPMVEKMDNGDCLFFFVDDNGDISVNSTGRSPEDYDEQFLINEIKKQIRKIK